MAEVKTNPNFSFKVGFLSDNNGKSSDLDDAQLDTLILGFMPECTKRSFR